MPNTMIPSFQYIYYIHILYYHSIYLLYHILFITYANEISISWHGLIYIQCCSRGTDHLRDPENKARQFGQNLRTRLYRSPAGFVYGFCVAQSVTVGNNSPTCTEYRISIVNLLVANGYRPNYEKTVNKSSWRSIKSSSQILTKLTALVLWVSKVVSSPWAALYLILAVEKYA
jgi:hypothetical protein